MATPVLMLLLKVSLVLAATFAAAWLARRGPAAGRHRLWTATFASILALPLIAAFVPAFHVPLPARLAVAPQNVAAPALGAAASGAVALEPPPTDARSASLAKPPSTTPMGRVSPSGSWRMPSLSVVLLTAWAAGVLLSLAALAVALFRVRTLARGATAVTDPRWLEAVGGIARQLGMRRTPRVLMSADVSTPMAGGITRPAIFVPATASAWDDERRDVVLAHEAAHLAGRDPARLLLARIAVALYWFHPLTWLAAHQAAAAREQACDEAVITLGTRPSTYARVLLEFADATHIPPSRLAALPMVQPTLLEKRLMTILKDDVRPAARRLAFAPAAAAAFAISVAAAQPAPSRLAQPAQPVPTTAGIGQVVTRGVAPGVAGGQPGGISSGVPGGVAAGVPGGVAGGVVGAVPGGVAGMPLGSAPAGAQTPESACDWRSDGDFHHSISMSDRGGRTVIHEQVGRRGSNLVIQKTFADLRVCALIEGLAHEERLRPGEWAAARRPLVLETQQGGDIRRMAIDGARITWSVNGQQRAPDAASKEWADRVSDLLDPVWELSQLRGEMSSLRGQISSIHGQRSSLQGQISSLRGQVSSMRGEISSWRGQESSLRGQISSIQGHLSSLRGLISSERGGISTLEASRWNASDAERARIAERIRAHEARIKTIQADIASYDADAKIREVEKALAQLAVHEKVAEVEKRLRAFDVEQQVAAVEKRIAQLDVARRVAAIEQQIASLDVDRRARDLEARIEAALKRLRAVL